MIRSFSDGDTQTDGQRCGQRQHSIRVNDQYRICFTWSNGGAENVQLVDYHD